MKLKHWIKWNFYPPIIVLISGKARHGKDTFGRHLMRMLKAKHIDVQRISFGDKLKEMTHRHDRDYLQAFGTAGRKLVNKDIWIIKAVADYKGADVVVITDTRYPNEISKFEIAPNIAVRVNRIDEEGNPWESNLTKEQKSHPSETALDNFIGFDYVIDAENVTQLEDAARSVCKECLEKMEKIREERWTLFG